MQELIEQPRNDRHIPAIANQCKPRVICCDLLAFSLRGAVGSVIEREPHHELPLTDARQTMLTFPVDHGVDVLVLVRREPM